MNPWDYHAAFSQDFLVRIGDILRRARDSAARHARPKLGDRLCSIGLVAYERSCAAIEKAAAHEYSDWLSVAQKDNHFVVKIHGIPARFYRGDSDSPIPPKTLELGPAEKEQTELVLRESGLADVVKCVRFEVEKNEKGFTKGVNFVLVGHDDRRVLSWPIPRYVANDAAARKGSIKLAPISLDSPNHGVQADEGTA